MLEDHLRVFKSLNKNRVRYLVIGGVACAVYGSPRATFDLDIAIEPTLDNSNRLIAALKEADFGTAELTTAKKIVANEINILNDYIKLDVLTKVKGIEFGKCWGNRNVKNIKGVRVNFASLEDLIASKKAANRAIDKYDLKILKSSLR